MSVLGTDDFNRADSTEMGADWTPISTEFGREMHIVSNAVKSAFISASSGECYVTAGVLDDAWAEVKLVSPGADGVGSGYGVTLRATAGGATRNGYRLVGNADGYELTRWDASSMTSLASGSGTTFANGDTIYCEMQGSTFVAKKGTTQGAGGTAFGTLGTDSTYADGYYGIGFGATADGPSLDDFAMGDFSGGANVNLFTGKFGSLLTGKF